MATWKEIGEVPDSEDDEDLESWSNTPPEKPKSGTLLNDFTRRDEKRDARNAGDIFQEDFWVAESVDIGEESDLLPGGTGMENEDSRNAQADGITTPFGSPRSGHDLIFSPLWFEKGNRSEERESSNAPGAQSQNFGQKDDISMSYVRITSTSLPSSPLGSLPNLPHSLANLYKERKKDGEAIAVRSDTSPPPAAKRAFRQRKQIQLHPYGIEQQKYQRTLKERGIAPILIVQSQEERHRALASSNTDSQLPDSNTLELEDSSDDGFVVTEDSQAMESGVNSSVFRQPLLQSLHSQDLSQVSNQVEGSDDDDFPDIDELLKQRPSVPFGSIKRPQMKYSLKSRISGVPSIQTKESSKSQSHHAASIFGILASPPATSPTLNIPFGRTISRTVSTSSKASFAVVIPNNRNAIGQPDSILTPATSSVKRSLAIHIDSDSDNECHFPGAEDESESTPSSSSDESIEIRRMAKKIRGVLPASHLRLDLQNRRQAASISPRQVSRSPTPPAFRRGVAIPASRKRNFGTPVPSTTGISFLENLSDDEDDEESALPMFTPNHDARSELYSLHTQSRIGFAEEEDRIDAMLPARKRQAKISSSRPFKKRRLAVSAKISGQSPRRQPKITELLSDFPPLESRNVGRSLPGNNTARMPSKKNCKTNPGQIRNPRAPQLSILDFADADNIKTLPVFIRVAARTARARRDLGRQSPTKKYIKLANREDTFEAQFVLQQWKEAKLKPRDLQHIYSNYQNGASGERQRIENNQLTRLRSPTKRSKPAVILTPSSQCPRKLIISEGPQQSMEDFIYQREAPAQVHATQMQIRHSKLAVPPRRSNTGLINSSVRPAQLEANDLSDLTSNPLPSFHYSKRVLDKLYKASRKRASPQVNISLRRLLADEDIPLPSTESQAGRGVSIPPPHKNELPKRVAWRKKRQPQRIDIGAAIYRQPSNPLILDFLISNTMHESRADENKLLGLGKYGTIYTVGYDIFPLPSGVFFHESTFIGSGRLAQALEAAATLSSPTCTSITLSLGPKSFTWGLWNEHVSSELGICFDWIIDQIIPPEMRDSGKSVTAANDVSESILRYFQDHISLPQPQNIRDFFLRIIELLQDFLERISNCVNDKNHEGEVHGILRSACLICFRVLLLSRKSSDHSHEAFQVETLLQSFARCYVKILMSGGLDELRKLYDKVQYLSFRERGISNGEALAEGLVVILRILETAQIPKGSFWDVVNSELLGSDSTSTQDARVLERLWYFMFTLLPLCEFDNFGVVIPGHRHVIAFDNWALPQQLLRRVFALYRFDQRQPPTFNDYCRALVHRCYHLMVEWGWWKCSGIIGTIFDFFASQNLAHLRNEEVYASPHFLLELHLDPPLVVEPEDRCFHIFLKITALGIKHLEKIENDKGVRNLVARLLPNHDRQYPKEEEIHQRDLASLRNHHDLLCTIFWAAPARHRLSPILIQKLVVIEKSHTQACLINLRAWENLVQFILTMAPKEENFRPFSTWQKSALDALWQQYQNAETEVRRQADELTTKEFSAITEAQIQETSKVNRDATKSILATMLQAMSHARNFQMPLGVAKMLFNIDFLAQLLDNKPAEDFSTPTIDGLEYYIQLISRPINSNDSDESQESQLALEILNRFEAISELAEVVVRPFQRHLQSIITSKSSNFKIQVAVTCWTSLIHLLATEEIQEFEFQHFVGSGRFSIFNHNKPLSTAEDQFWTTFLQEILSRNVADSRPLDSLGTSEFDIGSEWLRVLANPPTTDQISVAVNLSVQLHELGHCLLRLPIASDGVALPVIDRAVETKDSDLVRSLKPIEILKWALSSMKGIVQGGATARPFHLGRTAAKDLFNWQLQYLMRSMQERLQRMDYNSPEHKHYVEHVQGICEMVQIYCSAIRPLDHFFQNVGIHYWPPQSDPHRFAPFAKSFSLDLAGENPHKAARSLFYFLINSFDQILTRGAFQSHTFNLKKAMKEPSFLRFVLDELLTPMIEIGFGVRSIPGGWLFCTAYMPAIGTILCEYLLQGAKATRCLHLDEANTIVFQWTMKAAETVVFYIQLHQQSYKSNQTGRFNSRYQEILAISIDFWHTILPGLLKHQAAREDSANFDRVKAIFEQIARAIKQCIEGKEFELADRLFTSTARFRGVYYEEFRHGLETYVLENWTAGSGDGSIMLNKSGQKLEFGPSDGSILTDWGPKIVGIRRPDLMRAIVHLNQKTLNFKHDEGLHRLLATFV